VLVIVLQGPGEKKLNCFDVKGVVDTGEVAHIIACAGDLAIQNSRRNHTTGQHEKSRWHAFQRAWKIASLENILSCFFRVGEFYVDFLPSTKQFKRG